MYVCMYMYTYIHICMCVCIYICMYVIWALVPSLVVRFEQAEAAVALRAAETTFGSIPQQDSPFSSSSATKNTFFSRASSKENTCSQFRNGPTYMCRLGQKRIPQEEEKSFGLPQWGAQLLADPYYACGPLLRTLTTDPYYGPLLRTLTADLTADLRMDLLTTILRTILRAILRTISALITDLGPCYRPY